MPLDLQVEKEFLLTKALRMNSDIEIGQVSISAVEIQRKAVRWRVHPAKSPTIDWEDAPQPLEGSRIHQGICDFTDGSKIVSCVGSGVVIFVNGVLVNYFYGITLHATVFQSSSLQ